MARPSRRTMRCPVLFMKLLRQPQICGCDGQSRPVQSYDIRHEYAAGLYASECPSRVASVRFRDEPS